MPNGEGVNIPFNMGGNAEEQLRAINEAVQRVINSIKELNATISQEGPDKKLSDQAKRAARAIQTKTNAIKKSSDSVKQQVSDSEKLTEAERLFNKEVEKVKPTLQQKTKGVQKATKAIQKQKEVTEELIQLQKVEADSAGRVLSTYDAKAKALDNIIRRQNAYKESLETARLAEKKGIATQKELDILARSRGEPTLKEQQERLKEIVDRQAAHEKEAADLEKARQKDETARTRKQEAYNKRLAAARLKRGRKQRAREARWAKEAEAERRKAARLIDRQRRAQDRLNKSGNRAAFIFRRLFGILAAFTAARYALRGFFGGIQASVEFNKNIEQAQLGIASIFTAVGNVRDAMGNTVDASTGLALAQKEAARQTKLLRKDALTTAATFDQLLETFQIGLAPGIAAGLNIDEVRKFTLRISQAATAIGLAQNQLAEEIRSILSGTIQARTTRIAVALGITNEDIRRAKEYGKLFEFLDDRFKAFEKAGEKAMSTVAGLLGRVKDAFLQLLGAAGVDFFERIREGLLRTFKTLTVETPEGFIEPSPEALKAFEEIFDGLEAAADHAMDLADALELGDLKGVGAIIGQVLDKGTEVLAGIVQGIAQAARVIAEVIKSLGLNLPTGELREMVASITKWVALLIAGKTALGLIVGIVGKIDKLFLLLNPKALLLRTNLGKALATSKAFLATHTKIAAVLKIAATRLLAWGSVLGVVLLATRKSFERMLDIDNLSLTETIEILYHSFVNGFLDIVDQVKIIWIQFKDWVGNTFAPGVSSVFKKASLSIVSVIPMFKDDAIKALQEIYEEEDRLTAQKTGGDSPAVKAAKEAAKAAKEARDKELGDLINTKRKESEEETKLHDLRLDHIDKEGEEVNEFKKLLEEIPLVIGQGTQALSIQADVVQKIKDDYEDLQQKASFQRTGLTGAVSQQARLQVQAQTEIFKSFKQINQTVEEQRKKLKGITQQKRDLMERTKDLNREEVAQVANIVNAGQTYFHNIRSINAKDKEAALLKQGITSALERGNVEQAKALTAQRQKVLEDKKELELAKEKTAARGEAAIAEADPDTIRIAQEALTLEGQRLSVETDIRAAVEGRNDVEEQILNNYRERIRLVQEEANLEATRTLPVRQAQLNLQKTINDLQTQGFVRTVDKERAEAEARLLILQKELEVIDQKTKANVFAAQAIEAEAQTLDQIAEAKKNLTNVEEDRRLQLQMQLEELRKQQIIIAQIRQEQEAGIFAGLEQGLANFADRFSSEFLAGIRIMETAVEGLANLISTEIAEAFDPSTDQTWKQRLGLFLRQFSRMIINELVKLAIAKAILGLAGGPASGGGFNPLTAGLGAIGFNRGGRLERKHQILSHYSSFAQGLAGGGKPKRPAGLHPKDTIPIWGSVGEYMHRAKAVKAYGVDIMDKINRVSIDPLQLRALASNTARVSSRIPSSPGFQEGGVISEVVSRTAAEQGAQQSDRVEQDQPLVGVLVANEETMGRLVDNGAGSMLRFIKDNASEISSMLRQ